MSGVKEIKSHIASVQDTQKITEAMYLIASAKMRKAKEGLDRTRPYFNAVQAEIKRIFRTDERVENRYFYPLEGKLPEGGTVGVLVVTADKGLAGAYNQNVIKAAKELAEQKVGEKELFVVGEYGRQYYKRHNIPIRRSFLYTAQNPTMQRAREIASVLLDAYNAGKLKKIYIVYTDMKKRAEKRSPRDPPSALPPRAVLLRPQGEPCGIRLRALHRRGTRQHHPELSFGLHLQRPRGQFLLRAERPHGGDGCGEPQRAEAAG